jgi:hypothetical protein
VEANSINQRNFNELIFLVEQKARYAEGLGVGRIKMKPVRARACAQFPNKMHAETIDKSRKMKKVAKSEK